MNANDLSSSLSPTHFSQPPTQDSAQNTNSSLASIQTQTTSDQTQDKVPEHTRMMTTTPVTNFVGNKHHRDETQPAPQSYNHTHISAPATKRLAANDPNIYDGMIKQGNTDIDSDQIIPLKTQPASRLLVVGVSTGALFDLRDSHKILETEGIAAYTSHENSKANEILRPGVAFNLVKKLIALNEQLGSEDAVDVVIISKNQPASSKRILNSLKHHDLGIQRTVFTSGETPPLYAKQFGVHLFLSTNREDVVNSLHEGIAAAHLMPSVSEDQHPHELRIAVDGDGCWFPDHSERIMQNHGLTAFIDHEAENAATPMNAGPLKPFMSALQALRDQYHTHHRKTGETNESPIHIALVTARSTPAMKRALITLEEYGTMPDLTFSLGGLDKGDFLKAFDADFFLDDKLKNCSQAANYVPTGHVVYGVLNEENNNTGTIANTQQGDETG